MLLRVIGVTAIVSVVLPCSAGGAWTSAAAPTATTANSVTFQDSTGERPDSPDITTVVVSIKINTSELGSTTRFNFDVIVITGLAIDPSTGDLDFTNARADFAPDPGHGLWNFSVKTVPLRLLAKSFALTPRRPLAGRTLTANMTVARNDTGAVLKGGSVICSATVGGARVAVRIHKFVGSQARCAWQIPSSARGKSIHGSVTVVFEGKRISRSFAATVG